MAQFTLEQLRQRAFLRVSSVLHGFWEEQQHLNLGRGSVHSRLFDTLVLDAYITLPKSKKGHGHKEHVVPCAYLRDHSFRMFTAGKSIDDVALMIGRLLRIAYITREEALEIDVRWKTTMPPDWDPEAGSILARLDAAGVELEPALDPGCPTIARSGR
jgi:hypothetical protein